MVLEELLTNPVVAGALPLLGRNLYGWAVNSLKDGKIQTYELKQLLNTLLKLGGVAVFAYFALPVVVQGVDPTEAGAVVALVDAVKSYLKKK